MTWIKQYQWIIPKKTINGHIFSGWILITEMTDIFLGFRQKSPVLSLIFQRLIFIILCYFIFSLPFVRISLSCFISTFTGALKIYYVIDGRYIFFMLLGKNWTTYSLLLPCLYSKLIIRECRKICNMILIFIVLCAVSFNDWIFVRI